MKVVAAADLVIAGELDHTTLWRITTDPERIQLALILGLPDQLPAKARTPAAAWSALNAQQQRLVLEHAPSYVLARLPTHALRPAAPPPRPRRRRRPTEPAPAG